MKFRILFLMAILLTLFTGCDKTVNENSEIKYPPLDENKKVIVGVDDNFSPFSFKDEQGNIIGFDIDLAKEMMLRLGRPIEFKAISWSEKENELNTKQIDMIWSGLEITENRKKEMIFTEPYMQSGLIVFVRKNLSYKIQSKEDLMGLTIGIQAHSTSEMHIDGDDDIKYSIKKLVYYGDIKSAFKELLDRNINAVVCDEINGRYYIFKNNLENKVEATDLAIGAKGQVAVGFQKDNMELRDEVEAVLEKAKDDGTIYKMSEKWFGKNLVVQNSK